MDVFFAEGVEEDFFFAADLEGVSGENEERAEKGVVGCRGDGGGEDGGEEAGVEGMADEFVGTGADEAVAFFEADNAELVREVNETAQIPFKTITEAMDLTPA